MSDTDRKRVFPPEQPGERAETKEPEARAKEQTEMNERLRMEETKERMEVQDFSMTEERAEAATDSPGEPSDSDGTAIVLIDGVCHLCQWLVAFIIPRDPLGHFRFAPLQSGTGRKLLEGNGLDARRLDTVVLIEKGSVYTESAAALRILRGLRFPWKAAYLLIAIPVPLRDRLYRYVAGNRYRWFGRDDQCLMPTPDIRRRFLE